MNNQARVYFRVDPEKEGSFQAVRFLSEEPDLTWSEAEKLGVPRAWFELSRIPVDDRLDFIQQLWLEHLPFHPLATPVIEDFFQRLDDAVILVARKNEEDPWRTEIVYSMADNSTFFRGLTPANERDIDLTKKMVESDLPAEYWSFMRLHNGFGRLSELGMLALDDLEIARKHLIDAVEKRGKPLRMGDIWLDPRALFPFYEEYGLSSFQCFNAEWYPSGEMGNVHFSGIDYTLSDTLEKKEWAENLAFPTFVEWLAAFLQGMNSCI